MISCVCVYCFRVSAFFITMGLDHVSVQLWPLIGPLSVPQMIHERIWSSDGMILTGKTKGQRKTCPSATLSTTKPTWTSLGANPGLLGEKPVSNCLCYGKACKSVLENTCVS